MNKPLKLLLATLASGLMLSACSNEASTEPKTENESATKPEEVKTLTIGSDMTFPPYEYLDEEGNPQGLDVDLMAKMAENHGGFKPEWMDTRWANLIPGLKGEKFDVLYSSMYITKDRLKQIDMIPYYKTDISLLVRSDSDENPQGPGDLCGKKVGSMKGTAFSSQLVEISDKCVAENNPAIEVREYETSPQTTQALLSNAVDIQYDDAAVMKNAVKKLGGRVKITSTQEFYPIVGGIGVRKGDTDTYNLINDGIQQMRDNGQLDEILGSYGLQVPTQEDIDKVMK